MADPQKGLADSGLADVTAEGVRKAMAEFDEIGRDAFLEKYGFGQAKDYYVVVEGRRYDSKAIVGVARGYDRPDLGYLPNSSFSGGKVRVQRLLERLGFMVEGVKTDDSLSAGTGSAPRSLAQLDRYDPEHARLIIEKVLLPDPAERETILRFLLELIQLCEDTPAAWTMTLRPRNCALIVGWGKVLAVGRGRLSLGLQDEALGRETRDWLQGAARELKEFKSFPGTYFAKSIPHDAVIDRLEQIRPAVFAATKRLLADSGTRSPWRFSFSPGVLEYLENQFDTKINYPDFSGGPGRTRYWKISPGRQAARWDDCREGGFIGMGFPLFGDLSETETREEFEAARAELEEQNEGYTKTSCAQLWSFRQIAPGDKVVANRGTKEVLGIGTVTDGYQFEPSDEEHPHRLKVDWYDTTPRSVDEPSWRRTLREVGLAEFRALVAEDEEAEGADETGESLGGFAELQEALETAGLFYPTEVVANFLLALQTKRFVILTGISGTGKTRLALEVAGHYRGSISKSSAVDLPEDATAVTVRPYMLKYRGMVLPAEVFGNLRVPELGPTNSAEVLIEYPKGRVAANFWKDPSRPVARLALAEDLGRWFRSHLSVGDTLLLEVPQNVGDVFLRLSLPEVRTDTVDIDSCAVVAVRPDWTDHRGLLGFLNPLTEQYSTTPFLELLLRAAEECENAEREERSPHPFFAILDEMNLARVEHYFSDFLSALESGEPLDLHGSLAVEEGSAGEESPIPRQLPIPDNLFFVGTVNVDESTYMFSPKVLDRAFTIELNEVGLFDMGGIGATEYEQTLSLPGLPDVLQPARPPSPEDWRTLCSDHRDVVELINSIHQILKRENRHFGYRVANEMARFVLLAVEQAGSDARDVALDLAFLQKVMPKLHGSQQELEQILDEIFAFALLGEGPSTKDVEKLVADRSWTIVGGKLQRPGADGGPTAVHEEEALDRVTAPFLPRSAAKLYRMRMRLAQHGFTSFIE